jgi:hypothetical protein
MVASATDSDSCGTLTSTIAIFKLACEYLGNSEITESPQNSQKEETEKVSAFSVWFLRLLCSLYWIE